ncbi:MAG: DNA polymerase III subunit beta [Thermogutta sp.]|nr:DNA polymerase III subunit beta [Thermogutta sp.]
MRALLRSVVCHASGVNRDEAVREFAMKVVAQRESLAEMVQLAQAVCPGRSARPILENLLLECRDGAGVLMATDLEVGLRLHVPELEVEVPGTTLLPARTMLALLRELTDEEIRLESQGDRLLVLGEKSEFQFPTPDAMEFPEVPDYQAESYHAFTARNLSEMLRRTEYAVETEGTRFNLGGVYLELGDEKVTAVGTDGRRLASQEGQARRVGGHRPSEDVIIPRRVVEIIQRILSRESDDQEVKLAVEDGKIFVITPSAVVSGRLVDARFPKWREVFPKAPEKVRVDLPVREFASATRQASIVVDEKNPGIVYTFSSGKLVLSGRGASHGESRVELPIGYDGEEAMVRLNQRFILDFLKVLGDEGTFTLKIWSEESPVLAETSDGYAYLMMPLVLGSN